MPSFKLPLAAALVTLAFAAPAAQAEVHRETVVHRTVVTHHVDGDHHRSRKVCKNVWSHHRKVHKCSWVRWHG